MRLVLPALALIGLVFSLGCGLELAKQEGEERRAAGGGGIAGMAGGDLTSAPAPAAPETTEPQPADSQQAATPTESEAAPAAPPPNTTAAEDAVTVGTPSGDPNVETVAAKRGVGKTGRYEGSGMVVTPIKAYFLTKQRTELEIKIPHALNLYKAEHGHFPKTLEDFMRDIIEFNQVKLPELPAGHRYVYKAETGELMVERPAN
jgi:hypothetical protein